MRKYVFRLGLFAALLAGLAGCILPRDPEGTTDAVSRGRLVVGLLTEALPAADARVVRALAARLDAEAETVTGPAHDLLAGLETGEVHVLAGDIPADTPLGHSAGLSRAAGQVRVGGKTEDRVFLIRKGENRFLFELNTAIGELGGDG